MNLNAKCKITGGEKSESKGIKQSYQSSGLRKLVSSNKVRGKNFRENKKRNKVRNK